MCYKPLRSSFSNSILYGVENCRKKITIQQEKLISGTLPESPVQDLCKVIWQDYSFWLEELMSSLINEGTQIVWHLSENSLLTEIYKPINHPKISLFSLHIVPIVELYRAEKQPNSCLPHLISYWDLIIYSNALFGFSSQPEMGSGLVKMDVVYKH